MEFRWIGGPMLILHGVAYGLWFNHDLTPWRDQEEDTDGMWFGRRSWTATNYGCTFKHTIIALGLVAFVRNELLA